MVQICSRITPESGFTPPADFELTINTLTDTGVHIGLRGILGRALPAPRERFRRLRLRGGSTVDRRRVSCLLLIQTLTPNPPADTGVHIRADTGVLMVKLMVKLMVEGCGAQIPACTSDCATSWGARCPLLGNGTAAFDFEAGDALRLMVNLTVKTLSRYKRTH